MKQRNGSALSLLSRFIVAGLAPTVFLAGGGRAAWAQVTPDGGTPVVGTPVVGTPVGAIPDNVQTIVNGQPIDPSTNVTPDGVVVPEILPAARAWAPAAIASIQNLSKFADPLNGGQPTPATIPKTETDPDPTGTLESYQPGGATKTSKNAFFLSLGTNERTCFTCHQPATDWTITATSAQTRFNGGNTTDPLFRLIDGATCPTDPVGSIGALEAAFSLLLSNALIRVGLPVPATAQFTLSVVNDPYSCSDNPQINNPDGTPIFSVYRRPLPTTNLVFQTDDPQNLIMWDGREPSLLNQSMDATLIHAQALVPPTPDQSAQMVDFETGIFTAQQVDNNAGNLTAAGATGGAVNLSNQPFGFSAPTVDGSPGTMSLYTAWESLTGTDATSEARESIARGQVAFNIKRPAGSCTACHNIDNVGNHDGLDPASGVLKFFNTGLGLAGANAPPAVTLPSLPVFQVTCVAGPLAGTISEQVTDLGRAMITGECADIASFKTPGLRGLAGRAPYFHNGSAPDLLTVVRFYEGHFGFVLTSQQEQDLANFLSVL